MLEVCRDDRRRLAQNGISPLSRTNLEPLIYPRRVHCACVDATPSPFNPILRWRRTLKSLFDMDSNSGSSAMSNSSQKRPAQDAPENTRAKRAKYTSTAWSVSFGSSRTIAYKINSNECKRCKVKCIRMDDNANCQRCSTMNVACIVVPTATQTAKEKDKSKDKNNIDE